MSEDVSLDQIVANVQAAASDCNTMIVEAIVEHSAKIPIVAVTSSEFTFLITHLRPKLIYVSSTKFNSREQVMEALDEEDETSLNLSSSKKLVSTWRSRNGETCRIILALMYDAVLHVLVEEAKWFADFEVAADALSEEVEEIGQESTRKVRIEERTKLSSFVKQLISDPRFSAAKVGVAKRTLLAETLFPDLDQDVIGTIVVQAENDFWLATAGRKS